MKRLILTLTGLNVLTLTLLSSNRLALAPDWLLQIFGEPVRCSRRDRAVLGSWTALPTGWEYCSEGLVFMAPCQHSTLM